MHSLISKRHGGGAGSTPGYVQTSDPWAGQAKYAEGIAYTSLALILIFAIVSIPHRARSLHPTLGAAFQRLPGYASIAALLRWFSYRRVGGAGTAWGPLNLRLPALGVCLLMAAFFVAFTAWSFAIRPYYRPLRGDGSPPLALRTGWMALGLLPFIYALGSKVNFVAAITGSSHERLQVWHQWAGRFALFLATIHTLPFIVQPLRYGGAAELREYFFSENINITGTVAYACLFVLVMGSFARLRERRYELWLALHIPVAIVFLVYMFIHCSNILTSWTFMGVSAGLYGASVFLRVARQLHTNDFLLLARAEVSALPDGVTKLVVPTAARWSAGQHVFVRLPGYGQGFGMVQSHPFTIISLPNANPHKTVSNVVLMARARGGLTKALYDHALAAQGGVPLSSWSPDLNDSDEKAQAQNLSALSMPAILDGPYGASASVAGYDEALFMAGGSGATFVVASLMDLVWQWRNGTASTKRADFVWAVREADSIDWLREQLEAAWTLAPPGHLSITLHITSSRAPALDSDPSTSPSASASSSPSPESSGADTTLRHRAPPTTTKTLPTGPSNSNSSSNLNLPKGWAVHSGPHVRPAVKELLRSFAQRAANEPASISTSSTSATARRPAPPSHGDSFTSDPEKDGAGGASTPPNAPSGLAYQPDSLSSPSANPATSARPALAILVCGPIGMASDASNAASDLQMDILRGRLNLAEVWLCNEAFGW